MPAEGKPTVVSVHMLIQWSEMAEMAALTVWKYYKYTIFGVKRSRKTSQFTVRL